MTKAQREEKWDNEFIPCKNHPLRRCGKSAYVNSRHYECGSCKHKRLDGTLRPYHTTYDHSEQRRWKDRSRETQERIEAKKI